MTQKTYPKRWMGNTSSNKGVRATITGMSEFFGYDPAKEAQTAGMRHNLANVKSQQSASYTVRDLDTLFRKAGLPQRRTFPMKLGS